MLTRLLKLSKLSDSKDLRNTIKKVAMAISDIAFGNKESGNTYDYSHLLTPAERAEGLTIRLVEKFTDHPKRLEADLMFRGDSVGWAMALSITL